MHTCKETDKVLHGYFVTTVVDFDVIPVEIEALARVGVYVSGEFVAVIAGCIVREHEDYVGVWNTESFDCAVPVSWLFSKCCRTVLFR